MCRVCEGLERVRLFIDDTVCFSKNGHETYQRFTEVFRTANRLRFETTVRSAKKSAPRGKGGEMFGPQGAGGGDSA